MSDESRQGSPFARPGFVVAAVGLGAVLVAGGVVAGKALTADDSAGATGPGAGSEVTAPVSSTPESSAPSGSDAAQSVCGLQGLEEVGTVSTAPEAQWSFQGTTPYPTSAVFGPAASFPSGVRYCFQHTPEGALFAAANASVQGSDGATSREWADYFLSARTPQRDMLLADAGTSDGADASTRVTFAGFRMMSYAADAARVEVVHRAVASGSTVYAAAVYDLVWEAGDWKWLPEDPADPLQLAQVPDTTGYVTWAAG